MILDTNILIGLIAGDEIIVSSINDWRSTGGLLFISLISVTETLSLASLTQKEIEIIESHLASCITLYPDSNVARSAAAFRRSHALSVADAYILATAAINHLPLATRDKQMRKVPHIAFADI